MNQTNNTNNSNDNSNDNSNEQSILNSQNIICSMFSNINIEMTLEKDLVENNNYKKNDNHNDNDNIDKENKLIELRNIIEYLTKLINININIMKDNIIYVGIAEYFINTDLKKQLNEKVSIHSVKINKNKEILNNLKIILNSNDLSEEINKINNVLQLIFNELDPDNKNSIKIIDNYRKFFDEYNVFKENEYNSYEEMIEIKNTIKDKISSNLSNNIPIDDLYKTTDIMLKIENLNKLKNDLEIRINNCVQYIIQSLNHRYNIINSF